MRDSKGRFKSKGLIISLQSAALIANSIILLFILLPWLYVGSKFSIIERIYDLLGSLFSDDKKCNCQSYDNGENKY